MIEYVKISPEYYVGWGQDDNRYNMELDTMYEVKGRVKRHSQVKVRNPNNNLTAFFTEDKLLGPFTLEETPEEFL